MDWNIILHFSGKNMPGFRFQDVVREFPDKHPANLAKILADMVEKGLLCKIAHDNYHIIPLNADRETYFPDSHQIAKSLMHGKEYYIGYASAVKIHGISLLSEVNGTGTKGSGTKELETGELANTEYIVTKKQVKPAIRKYGDISCQFIHHSPTRFFGFDSFWINRFEEAMVSDLEKTIVDITAKPQFCGSITEVGNILFQAKDMINYEKLFFYFAKNLNKSARKRFLFLTDLLGMEWNEEHNNMKDEIGKRSTLLDPSAPDRTIKRGKFGLRINVDPAGIVEEVLHG